VVHRMLHVLLDCFINLTQERVEKLISTVGHLVTSIIAVFELMTPRHYQIFRNSLMEGKVGDIGLDVSAHWALVGRQLLLWCHVTVEGYHVTLERLSCDLIQFL